MNVPNTPMMSQPNYTWLRTRYLNQLFWHNFWKRIKYIQIRWVALRYNSHYCALKSSIIDKWIEICMHMHYCLIYNSTDALNLPKVTVKAFLTLQNISISNKGSLLSPNNKAANQHIRMISEGPSDTEDWSNFDKLHFKIYLDIKLGYLKLFQIYSYLKL